jgi:superfamily II DNA or RNA helicase
MEYMKELEKGIVNGFINGSTIALEDYKPKLIVNNSEKGEKVLTCIHSELKRCDEFLFSVAFVTESGVLTLLNILQELEAKGVRGRIIASQYQNFSEPKALDRLRAFNNIELRIVTDEKARMHTKGYIFRKGDEYSIIVGSSNLTQYALCQNKEWNLKVSSSTEGSLIKNVLDEFEYLYTHAITVDDAWLTQYREIYNRETQIRHHAEKQITELIHSAAININQVLPNQMQLKALEALDETRHFQNERALIISATGTGKTYLSAFDVKKFNPRKFLFVVHREQIARAALLSFKKIFGHERKMSVLSGHNKDTHADFIFSTIQTLSKDEILHSFDPEEFDYIVIDEVHRAGAISYQKIINYFKPEFMLGMSATPERTDGFDIFELFNHNVAYEIRLQQAMKEDMICPFHYFGITELSVDGKLIDDKTSFAKLTSDQRVDNIIEKMKFYGFCGDRVKGLVFCSRKEEANALSEKFNALGYRTESLNGETPQFMRESAINRLEQSEPFGALDYIFTVDIFNEGVDIPAINQVVMLRPTQSAIIFVQQLGRGLRHCQGKEYVVVLDFIGNYEKNFLIPIALSGDQTYNKDTIRRYVSEGNRVIPGCSTVNFDAVTRERIFTAIDTANFNDIKLIKESYQMLKQRLGRIPRLHEFEENGSIDIERIFAKVNSYHNFLKRYEKDYAVKLSPLEEQFIEFISVKWVNGKRPHELELLKLLSRSGSNLFEALSEVLSVKYGIEINNNTVINLSNQMMQNFTTGSARDSYKDVVFIEKNGKNYTISRVYTELLKNQEFSTIVDELISVGLSRYQECYINRYLETNFQLYQKYTYEDVCRCLDWDKSEVALNIGGYKFDKKTKTYPVFINYNKSEDISDTIKYEDEFLSPSFIQAISKSNRTVYSEDVIQAYNAKGTGVEISLFVRRNKDDKISKEFYYLGRMNTVGKPEPFIMPNTTSNAVKIRYQLETPVREDLYDFITTD